MAITPRDEQFTAALGSLAPADKIQPNRHFGCRPPQTARIRGIAARRSVRYQISSSIYLPYARMRLEKQGSVGSMKGKQSQMAHRTPLNLLLCLSVASCTAASPNHEMSRKELIAQYAAVTKSWDKDRDGKLSRSDLESLVDHFIGEQASGLLRSPKAAQLQLRRRQLIADFEQGDTDHDGYLTLSELLKGPLAMFDCMDRNHDGLLSDDEVRTGMKGCASLQDRARQSAVSGSSLGPVSSDPKGPHSGAA